MLKFKFLLSFFVLILVGCNAGTDDIRDTSSEGYVTSVAYTGSLFDATVSNCNKHLSLGYSSNSADQVLCREGYAAGYNYLNKVANWVSYYITSESVSITRERVDSFSEDAEVPSQYRSTLDDYSGSGYDRGHLAPRATMDFTEPSMEESFLLTNIAPQNPTFNRGLWADIEGEIRGCTVEFGELYVVTGVAYNNDSTKTIGNAVKVPSYFYKAILKPSSPASAFAIYLPNTENSSVGGATISIDSLENILGYDLFSNVEDTIESTIETNSIPFCAEELLGAVLTPPTLELATPEPTIPVVALPPSDTPVCASKTTCGEMVNCTEAMYYLNTCGLTRLDGDSDGTPCEALCN